MICSHFPWLLSRFPIVVVRYSVKVLEDHLTSIQVNTSKADVHIKLVVLNNEEEVASTRGKGHAVIPAFTFLKDINPDEEPKRSTSRACECLTCVGWEKCGTHEDFLCFCQKCCV